MPRAKRAPKAKIDPSWQRDELIEKLLNEVAEQNHKHLERAKIVVLVKPRGGGALCCNGVGKLMSPSRAVLALVKEDMGEVHYITVIGRDRWEKLGETAAKKRVLDHLLCHAGGLDDKGRWFKVEHDVQEFVAVLKRHGLDDSPGLTQFVATAKQMKFPLKLAGA